MCEGVHCVDLGESFQTHVYLQSLASIQPRTSPLKFARSGGGRGGPRAAPGARLRMRSKGFGECRTQSDRIGDTVRLSRVHIVPNLLVISHQE